MQVQVAMIVLKHRQVDIRRCKGADVKTQAAINFLNATTILIFSKTSLRAPGQHVLMSMEYNPLARNVDHHTLRSKCNVSLRWANPVP